ncbi:hypothetical protein ACSQ67_023911 [Phaseolus vulgaris]
MKHHHPFSTRLPSPQICDASPLEDAPCYRRTLMHGANGTLMHGVVGVGISRREPPPSALRLDRHRG